MADIHDRDRKIIQWMKLGGLAYDLNHNTEMKEIFYQKAVEPKIEVLEKYGLTREDCSDFLSDIDELQLSGWWIGVREMGS